MSPFDVLGLPSTATAAEAGRAYRLLAQRHHPDTNPGDAGAVARFREVQAAYEAALAILASARVQGAALDSAEDESVRSRAFVATAQVAGRGVGRVRRWWRSGS